MDVFANSSYLGEDDVLYPPATGAGQELPAGPLTADSVPAGRWWQRVPAASIVPGNFDSDYTSAISNLESAYARRPQMQSPKWWQNLAGAVAGGLAGWSNAAGRTRQPVDIGAMEKNILEPGYGQKMARWQQNVLAPAQAQAKIEGAKQSASLRAEQLEAQAEMLRGRAEHYRRLAARPRAQGAPVDAGTPQSGGSSSGDAVPGNVSADAAQSDTEPVQVSPPPAAPQMMADGGIATAKAHPQVERVSPVTPNPPTASQSTVSESPATIGIQMAQLAAGVRAAVMLPAGTPAPDSYPPGTALAHDKFGNIYVFRKDLTSGSEIETAAKNNQLPSVLGSAEPDGAGKRIGLGTVDKSKLEGSPLAVVSRAADGREVQSSATDRKRLPSALVAARKLTPRGGRVSVERPRVVLAARREAVVRRPRQLPDLASPGSF